MHETLGTRLRRERERRQIALSSIAVNTKINPTLLEGLERDDVSRWPSGIFRRSYIRSYTEAIGLDPDPIVREFMELWPDPLEVWAEPVAGEDLLPPSASVNGSAPVQPTFTEQSFAEVIRRRAAAAACDVCLPCLIASALFLLSGHFWTPLGVSVLVYYCGGIVLLGNTPGVCLFGAAPETREGRNYSGVSSTL